MSFRTWLAAAGALLLFSEQKTGLVRFLPQQPRGDCERPLGSDFAFHAKPLDAESFVIRHWA